MRFVQLHGTGLIVIFLLGITLLLILVLMQVQTSPSELEALTHMGNGLAVSCLLQIM